GNLALVQSRVGDAEQDDRAMFECRPGEVLSMHQLHTFTARGPAIPDLEDVKEKVLITRLGGRDFNTPCPWDYVHPVRTLNRRVILTPKCLPHMAQLRVCGQRTSVGWIERPVLPTAPGSAIVVAWRVELIARTATTGDGPLAGQKGMHAQLSRSLVEDKCFCVRKIAHALRVATEIAVNTWAVHAMQEPRFVQIRICTLDAIKHKQQVAFWNIDDFASKPA